MSEKELFKTCTECNRELPLSMFYYRNDRKRYFTKCKSCESFRRIIYYENNKEKILAKARERYREESQAKRFFELLQLAEIIKDFCKESEESAK